MLMLISKSSQLENLIDTIEEKHYSKKHTTQMQVLFVSFKDFCMKVAFVYIRETPTQEEIKLLKKDLSSTDLVMGDLNLDTNRSTDAGKLETLCSRKTKVLSEITTTRFTQLDHILLNCIKFSVYFTTSFINYTTEQNPKKD